MTVVATRRWSLPDTHNIRDLGGYARLGGGSTQWGRLLRGEALHPLRHESVEALVAAGLRTVIDLRGPHETGVNPHPFRDRPGVAYLNIVLYDAMDPIVMMTPSTAATMPKPGMASPTVVMARGASMAS